MKLQETLREVREQKAAPVYLLIGTELCLTGLFKTTLTKELLTEEGDQLNFFPFNMEETPSSVAIAEAEIVPFLDDYHLVLMEDPCFLTAERKTNGVGHDVSLLLNCLESPSPIAVLVLMISYEKLDERKEIIKALKKNVTVVDVNPMDEKATRQYTSQAIKSGGYVVCFDAFNLLPQLTGLNLSKIMGELQKLYLYTLETRIITRDVIQELTPRSLEHNVFDLTSEVLSGSSEKAVQLYEDLLLQGEGTIKLNAILLNQVYLFLRTKILARMGCRQANTADTLKVHPH